MLMDFGVPSSFLSFMATNNNDDDSNLMEVGTTPVLGPIDAAACLLSTSNSTHSIMS